MHFTIERRFLRGAQVQLDAPHLMQQPDDPARQPFRMGGSTRRNCASLAHRRQFQEFAAASRVASLMRTYYERFSES